MAPACLRILIDESQDTHEVVMEALLAVQAYASDRFALGLFGDTMQRIYTHGMQHLESAVPADWARPAKVMNYRSAERIVQLVNAIRMEVDGQQQRARLDQRGGFARLFITGLGAAKSLALEQGIARRLPSFLAGWDVIAYPRSILAPACRYNRAPQGSDEPS